VEPGSRFVGPEPGQHLSQLLGESRQLIGCRRVKDREVDRPVAVDDPVAQLRRPGLLHGGKPLRDRLVELRRSLAEHGEVPEQRISALAIAISASTLTPATSA